MLLLPLLSFSSLAILSYAIPLENIQDLVAPAIVPNEPPAVPPNEGDCSFQFFDQEIDHFCQHNGTFPQKYNLVTDFFEPGGPIFFYQGEEAIYLDCVWSSNIAILARVAPFGANDPVKQPQEFEYLTLDNVLADGVNFLSYLKKNITGARDSKVIVLSGSYGGFLSTAYRQNYPKMIYGAIASAPPVEAVTNNSKAENYWNWHIWLNNVYQDHSAEASGKIKNAINVLEKRFQSGNVSSLKGELGLYSVPTKDDFSSINAWIQNILDSAAEFNYPTIRTGRSPVALALDKVVNITMTQDDPVQILNETLWMWLSPSNFTCINLTDQNALYAAVPLIQQTIFLYLSCKYFPMNALPNVPKGTIFYATDSAGDAISFCDQEYNISTPSSDQLRTKYKYTPKDLQSSTRIIWSLGQYDPTSGVSPNQPGINAPVMSPDRNVSRVLYTTNMAHREDLFAPDPSDRDSVIQTRALELEAIKGWLGWYTL